MMVKCAVSNKKTWWFKLLSFTITSIFSYFIQTFSCLTVLDVIRAKPESQHSFHHFVTTAGPKCMPKKKKNRILGAKDDHVQQRRNGGHRKDGNQMKRESDDGGSKGRRW